MDLEGSKAKMKSYVNHTLTEIIGDSNTGESQIEDHERSLQKERENLKKDITKHELEIAKHQKRIKHLNERSIEIQSKKLLMEKARVQVRILEQLSKMKDRESLTTAVMKTAKVRSEFRAEKEKLEETLKEVALEWDENYLVSSSYCSSVA